MSYPIFVSCLLAIYFIVAIVFARKDARKREFANGFFFTLALFFLAFDESQKATLMGLLLLMTMYNMYVVIKKPQE